MKIVKYIFVVFIIFIVFLGVQFKYNLRDRHPDFNIDITINHPSKIKEISNHFIEDGDTEVKISIKNKDKNYVFKLKNKRLVDRKSLNLLKKHDISSVIY